MRRSETTCGPKTSQGPQPTGEAVSELRKPQDSNVLAVCRRIVAAQAQDEALWSPRNIVEGYLVQELRTLHAAIEGDLTALAAAEDL